MSTRIAGYDDLSAQQRTQLEGLQVHPGQLPFCGDIQSALYFLPREPNPAIKGFVLLEEDAAVAFLMLKRYPLVPHWAGEGSATLHALQMDRRVQGRGLGSVFLQALPEAARQAWPGLVELVLSVGKDNPVAMNLYRKQGWIDTGEAYLNERRMTLKL